MARGVEIPRGLESEFRRLLSYRDVKSGGWPGTRMCQCSRRPRDQARNPQPHARLEAMWGAVESKVTGVLKDFDVTDRLHEIQVPALVLSGVADEVTPVQAELLADGLPHARRDLFEHSAHMAILEEPEAHWAEVPDFLDQNDARTVTAAPQP